MHQRTMTSRANGRGGSTLRTLFLSLVLLLGPLMAPTRAQRTHIGGQSAIGRTSLEILRNDPREDLWVQAGDVSTMTAAGDKLYILGSFDQVGPETGPFAVLDTATAAPDLAMPYAD